MSTIYPYSWAGQFTNAEMIAIAKTNWQEVLDELTNEQIKKGLHVLKREGDKFPPSIPEFMKMCLPTEKELGIMPVERAYVAYMKEDYTNPIVHRASRLIDRYNWKMSSTEGARREFNSVYKLCVEEFLEEQKENRLLLTHTGENHAK